MPSASSVSSDAVVGGEVDGVTGGCAGELEAVDGGDVVDAYEVGEATAETEEMARLSRSDVGSELKPPDRERSRLAG